MFSIGKHKSKCPDSFFWLENAFSSNLNKIDLKMFFDHGGNRDLRDLKENQTNI